MNEVATLVSTVGFPIVACVFMYRFMTADLAAMRESLDNNTKVMQRILEHIKLNDGKV